MSTKLPRTIKVFIASPGDLDRAEEMHRKALAIHEKLGRLEGVANACVNLGMIYQMRGDLAEARRLGLQSRDLFAKIGMKPELATIQAWLDGLPDSDAPPADAK